MDKIVDVSVWVAVAFLGAMVAMGAVTVVSVTVAWAEVSGMELVVYGAVCIVGAILATVFFGRILSGNK